MISVLGQVVVAFLYANLVEWAWHKYVFHGLGKKKSSKFSSHWREHHRDVRKSGGYDLAYKESALSSKGPRSEVLELTAGVLLHTPFLFFAPVFFVTISIHAIAYFLIHRKSHVNIEWAKRWVPWHYDHHMGKNQDANWCVTLPVWDHILGTRLYFLRGDEYNNHN